MKHVKSGIPQGVIEEPTREQNAKDLSHGYRVVDCHLKGKLVGRRVYNREGILVLETPMKDGLKHGREVTWSDDGRLLSMGALKVC
jgi:hypothetical protein